MNTLTMIRILMAGCWFIAPIYYLSQSTTRGGMDAEMDDGDTARRGFARRPADRGRVRRLRPSPVTEGDTDAKVDDGEPPHRGAARDDSDRCRPCRDHPAPVAEPHSIYIGRGLYARHMGRG